MKASLFADEEGREDGGGVRAGTKQNIILTTKLRTISSQCRKLMNTKTVGIFSRDLNNIILAFYMTS